MSEDIYQIYRRIDEWTDLLASDMSIHDATLFIEAWMSENYNDQRTSLELRRQPMDYGRCAERNEL